MKEQERIEEALKESEERYRAVVEQSVEAIYLYDPYSKRILESNAAFQELIGYTAEELLGMTIYDFNAHHKADVDANVRRSLGQRGRFVGERNYHRKDGSTITVEISTSVIPYDGETALCTVSRDITERKRFEEVLWESEGRFRQLFERSTDALLVHDEHGRMVDCNTEACRSLGYTREELLELSVKDFATDVLSEEEKRERGGETPWSRAMAAEPGTVVGFHENWHRRKDGTTFPVEVGIGTIDYGGRRLIFASARDLTERKRTEEALKESEERYRAVMEQSVEAIYLYDAQTKRVLESNEAFRRMMGYTEEELIGRQIYDFIDHDRENIDANIRRSLKEKRRHIGERRYRCKDGTVILVDTSASATSYNGKTALCAVSRDITERRRFEEALKESERRFRSLIQNASDVITILEADGTIRYDSPSIERVLGHKPDERVGKCAFDYMHPEDVERVRRSFAEALGDPGVVQPPIEFRLRHKDGTWRYVEVTRSNLLDDPAVGGIVANTRDVTERKRAEEALKESEGRFRQLFERSTDALFVHDEVGRIVDCNAEACRSLGYTREELLELSVKDFAIDLLSEEEKRAKRGQTLWERAIRDEPGTIVGFEENELRRKDGTSFPVEVGVGAIEYEGRRLIFASVRDLTERKRAQKKLAEERELLRTLIDNMPDFIFVKDAQSRFVINNVEHARALGAPEEELVGKTDFDVFSRDLADRYYADEQEVIRSGRPLVDREEPVVDHTGNHRWLSTTKVPLRDGDGEISGLVGISRDITDRKALEEQLRHQAFHDPLTELPNRALFLDRLGHAISRSGRLGEPIAVLFVDLDDFKRINDSLGHETGDRLLVEVASRLSSCVRPGDTVARLFGDEFAVLLEAPVGMGGARRIAERIQERLRAPFTFDEQEVFVACSVGIVLNSADRGHQPKEVLRHADLAMYTAKNRGKNRYEMFNPSMDARASERMELENDLRRAIEREEFEVHYQPIVEAGSAKVAGLEALARWRHPERGLLAAKEFIQVAEYTGLIRPIGQLVFEEACRQAREWRERYPNREILMCVNFSASQFVYQADLIPKVLSDTGLDPEGLRLEITERAVMDDAEFSIGKLQRLKDLGVGFAIDDYGTGYSCLYYLKRMPVDSLKIDGSFVAGLGKDPGDDAIVSGTIDLAHALGLKVVAEGVETAEQHRKLKELNCDLAQGYYFSEPLPVDAASDLLKENNR